MTARERRRWRDGWLLPAVAGFLAVILWHRIIDVAHLREPLTTIIPVLVLIVGLAIGYVRRRRDRKDTDDPHRP